MSFEVFIFEQPMENLSEDRFWDALHELNATSQLIFVRKSSYENRTKNICVTNQHQKTTFRWICA